MGISDDLYEGYLVDDLGNVIGEARRYDPYSQFGDIMIYEMDSFGFIPGFIKKGLRLMSEEDLMCDENLRRSLKTVKYESWKRYNIVNLMQDYNRMFRDHDSFEKFCRCIYESTFENETKYHEKKSGSKEQ